MQAQNARPAQAGAQPPEGIQPATPAPPSGPQVFPSRAVAAAPHQRLGHLMVTLELPSLWEAQGTGFPARVPGVHALPPSFHGPSVE